MGTSWTIGSSPACDLRSDQPKVSGRHCRLTSDGDGYTLEDLGSTNGTYVNGVRIVGPVAVTRADAITLGLTTPMPWPPEAEAPGTVSVRIGRDRDNDLVVDLPMVSGHHALVTWDGKAGEATIVDLGSANGTAIGSPERKVARSALLPGDTIYLGTHAVPAILALARADPSLVPALPFRGPEAVVGRDPGCDLALDLSMISGRHARLARDGDRIRIEDLGSANGTFVNGVRIAGPTPVRPGDLIGLGSHAVRLVLDAPHVEEIEEERFDLVDLGVGRSGPSGGANRPSPGRAPSSGLPIAIVQAPIVAVAIGMISGGMDAAPGGAGVAASVFGLGLGAIWFGISAVLLAGLPDRGPGGGVAGWLPSLAVLCVLQCVAARAVVGRFSGLEGSWAWSLMLMALASAVGLAIGYLIVTLAPRPSASWAAVASLMALFWLFGGGPGTLPRVLPGAGTVARAMPSRWAFEGLLLLESARRPPAEAPGPDLAEAYFPADSERMGDRAALIAIASMLIGLTASAAYVSRVRASGRGVLATP